MRGGARQLEQMPEMQCFSAIKFVEFMGHLRGKWSGKPAAAGRGRGAVKKQAPAEPQGFVWRSFGK